MKHAFKFLSIPLITLLMTGAGCKKNTPETSYTFVNQLDKPVTVVIYRTGTEYDEYFNKAVTGYIPANGSYTVSSATLSEANTEYYIDWYTGDYAYSNWQLPGAQIVFRPADSRTFYIKDTTRNPYRNFILGDGYTYTKWAAIDAYVDSTGIRNSVWDMLSNVDKSRELKLNRDLAADITVTNDNQTHHTDSFKYQFNNATGDSILMNFNGVYSFPVTGRHSTSSAYGDTVWIPVGAIKYVFVKELQ